MSGIGNGDGTNGGSATIIQLLERIARGVESTNERVDVLTGRVDSLAGRVDSLAGETRRGFTEVSLRLDTTNNRIDATNHRIDATNARLDNVLHFVGSHHKDHEERIGGLEAAGLVKKA